MIKAKIGLDSNTIGHNTIDKIILQRMHLCDIFEFKDYLQLIKHSQKELNELLEISVIPETWFFRDIKPYEFIHQHIQQALLNNQSTHFKILSIPCSTGEEPYSLAMYLLEKGINPTAFSIDAVDVSQRAIQLAEKADYGENSFRGKHYHLYKEKYFSYANDRHIINSNIRDRIKFYPLNILHKPKSTQHLFDFILCRNLLIYFDADTKLIVYKNLSTLLKDSGYLFVGHSEFGSVPGGIFYNSGFKNAFALIKSSLKLPEKSTNTHNIKLKKNPSKKTNFNNLIRKKTIHIENKNNQLLDKAMQLANTLKFNEAEKTCRLHIKNQGEDADALYFLGLILDSQKKYQEAETYYRKSIYLNPKHYDALINLSLILEKNGDLKNSDLLKKRAEKSFLN